MEKKIEVRELKSACRAVIFDLDGTLADTLESLAYCTNKALADFGMGPLDKSLFKTFVGNGSRMQITRALRKIAEQRRESEKAPESPGKGDAEQEKAACMLKEVPRQDGQPDDDGFLTQPYALEQVHGRYLEYFAKDCMYGVQAYPGVVPLLEELKKRDIKTAVFSNKPHANTAEVVESLFGKGYFDAVRGQKDGFPKKPAPDGVYAVLEELGVSPQSCLYVGDSWVDIETGHNAGARSVGVLWGFRSREELEEHHADAVISSPQELLGLL